MNALKMIKRLYDAGKITKQQLKTYRGQILGGNEKAAIIGLRRKRLIE